MHDPSRWIEQKHLDDSPAAIHHFHAAKTRLPDLDTSTCRGLSRWKRPFSSADLRPSEAARCGGEGGTSADFGAIAASKKKNDRIDAGKIADCLRCAFLPECYMASTEIRERRRTLRYRHLLVRQVVQLADLITSCTLSFVSGENRFAPTTFQYVRPLLRSEANRIGGIGVKIHPESKYANLYHWLFGESYILHNVTYPLPLPRHPFPVSADRR